MTKIVTRTQYVVNTEDIIDFAVTKLQEYSGWTVKKFPGTGYQKLFKYIPELRLPAAIVCYNSSTFNKYDIPTRVLHLDILVAVEFYRDADKSTLLSMMHQVITLLDGEIFNKARFDITADISADLGPNTMASIMKFDVVNY